ncbi:class I SAM-dependent methyltransferase [Nitrospira sp. T9]|uniref:class I SAM-dependent methyltransferase n=1 Tax=unclassified Nitrospira TaxID=2652172 RepID=UPI003F9B853C
MMPTPSHSSSLKKPPAWLCELPKKDPWSKPFAESLLTHLDLSEGATILDVACGDGIPAFYLAHHVGPGGHVIGIDVNHAQLIRARAVQGPYFPWLEFRVGDVRMLPPDLGQFDRITGNLSFMFFRPHRLEALQQLARLLKPGGQLVLTFPSLGTFDSLWKRVDREMTQQGLTKEREAFADYLAERPSAVDARTWLATCGLINIDVTEYPLEVHTGPGQEFLYHPLLRGGFLDDVYECFADQTLADQFMNTISLDTQSFVPLFAQRCVMAGWLPEK